MKLVSEQVEILTRNIEQSEVSGPMIKLRKKTVSPLLGDVSDTTSFFEKKSKSSTKIPSKYVSASTYRMSQDK